MDQTATVEAVAVNTELHGMSHALALQAIEWRSSMASKGDYEATLRQPFRRTLVSTRIWLGQSRALSMRARIRQEAWAAAAAVAAMAERFT